MGLMVTKLYDLYQSWTTGPPVRVLLLGLDAAGKTTILYKLKLNEVVTTIPTIGFNVEEVTPVPGLTFTVWDIGGQDKIRRLWRHYYQASEGLIFVVDSCDEIRLAEARDELEGVLRNDGLPSGVPFVVLANKQDLPGALGPSKISEALHLRNHRCNPWSIYSTSATTGEGLYEGVEALSKMVRTYRKEKGMQHY